ncbi:MAG: hypothetical protein ACTSO7_03655 [Candidatus Heimdallarchaeota archaeon]
MKVNSHTYNREDYIEILKTQINKLGKQLQDLNSELNITRDKNAQVRKESECFLNSYHADKKQKLKELGEMF